MTTTAPERRPTDDGWADDAEYLDNVICAEMGCGDTRNDVRRCEQCGVEGCSCVVDGRQYDCGAPEDGTVLCEDCAPSHRGCRDCDPIMPWEN